MTLQTGKHPDLLYFRVAFSGIPMELPLQNVANSLLANASCHPTVEKIQSEYSAIIVAHRLQTFKEKLPSKYGHVDYFLAPGEGSTVEALQKNAAALLPLFATWLKEELSATAKIAIPGMEVKLVGSVPLTLTPTNSSVPFLQAFDKLELVKTSKDPLKVAIFLQTKLDYTDTKITFPLSGVSIPQMAWLRSQLPTFPEKAGSEELQKFFQSGFDPLNIEVKPMEMKAVFDISASDLAGEKKEQQQN